MPLPITSRDRPAAVVPGLARHVDAVGYDPDWGRPTVYPDTMDWMMVHEVGFSLSMLPILLCEVLVICTHVFLGGGAESRVLGKALLEGSGYLPLKKPGFAVG
ncbi:hypothetical protein ACIRQP_33640 [Streptomyces sp. NPDC102274]|uniref:hypothetical protein n=1 Tax=Streptomyces sp. NPDC102274 TaxID=3366151 RepID=UPI00380D6C5C